MKRFLFGSIFHSRSIKFFPIIRKYYFKRLFFLVLRAYFLAFPASYRRRFLRIEVRRFVDVIQLLSLKRRSSWKVYSVLRKLRRWVRKFNSQLYITIEAKFVEFCRSLKDTMLTRSRRKIDGTKCENKMIERQFSNIDSSLGAIYNGLNFDLDGSSSTRSRNWQFHASMVSIRHSLT